MAAYHFKETKVYRKAFESAMEIVEITKSSPKEERYTLTDQVQRSSRSVCINIAEGYRKKQYPAHFTAQISDADMESSETSVWLDFALSCQYIHQQKHEELINKNNEIGRRLYHMIQNPEKY
ncbi:MAG TPA: four helix bundle protein [Flavisolibacter sp.]|nr:four helix bundle protein [Flavisolibacter sp.]